MEGHLRIREATPEDAPAIARVRVDTWRTTYRGLLPDDFLDNLSYDTVTRNWRNILSSPAPQQVAFVAEAETGEVVGFALGGPERGSLTAYDGELYAIYLRQEYQGQGLGRGLASAVAQRLAAEGLTAMLVWVLKGNPAAAFYQTLGGQFVGEKQVLIGDSYYTELAYGWEDVRRSFGFEEG